MNFLSFLQVRVAAAVPICASIRYPDSVLLNPSSTVATDEQLDRCIQFQPLALNVDSSFQTLFRSVFHRRIDIPWRLDQNHLSQFAVALEAYKSTNPSASDEQTLRFIFEFPLRHEGWNLQIDQVSSREAAPERTAVEALRDHHTKCTGIAYVYAALLRAAGYNPQFAWRSQNSSGRVVEHLYAYVALPNQERYVFDPLFYSNSLHSAAAAESIATISPREVLAWHYNNEAIDLVNQSSAARARTQARLLEEARRLFFIASDLDPLNPYVWRNIDQMGFSRP